MFVPPHSDDELKRVVLAGDWGPSAPHVSPSNFIHRDHLHDANLTYALVSDLVDERFPLILSRRGLGFAEQVSRKENLLAFCDSVGARCVLVPVQCAFSYANDA